MHRLLANATGYWDFSSLSLGKFKPPKTSRATNGSLAWKLNDAPVFFKELHHSSREFRHHRVKE